MNGMEEASLTRWFRSPDDETLEVPDLYRRRITLHDRAFQQYSVDNSIHLVPVDEVSIQAICRETV